MNENVKLSNIELNVANIGYENEINILGTDMPQNKAELKLSRHLFMKIRDI